MTTRWAPRPIRGAAPRSGRGWLLAILIAWSAGVPVLAGTDDPRTTVNGVAIAPWEIERELALTIARGTYHKRVPDDRMAELECDALRRLVVKELKRQWVARNGVEVDRESVERAWQEVRGRFSSDDQYRAALAMKGIPEAAFHRAFERDAAAEAADAAVLAEVGPPTEDEVGVYFSLHGDRYTSPESRHVIHALVHVPPSAAVEVWQQAEARANELARGAAQGKLELVDAADELRPDLPPRYQSQVGDLGFVHRGSLLPALDEVVFDAALGSVSGPVRSIYGFHVVEVVDVRTPRPLELAEVYEAVAATLEEERRKRRMEVFEGTLRRDSVIEGGGCTGAR
ncbi:MAG TPA: peptidyl-prolyl cis-trans isomerase [Candidatus Sulfomarinibacteraceae bacterium]|nr:peptidyl-prolyl cis-trans isomerase [Candidatus Sulfomarinibacteraceae bacterium]